MKFTLREIPLSFLVTVFWDFDRETLGISRRPRRGGGLLKMIVGPGGHDDQPAHRQPGRHRRTRALVIAHELRTKLNNRLTGSGTAIGDPRIRAGAVIRFDGLGPDFSGDYRVASATHAIDAGGYRTTFRCARRSSHDRARARSPTTRARARYLMIEEMLSSVDQSNDELKKKFYGVTAGRVINPLDPLMLGRVQVQLPFIDALDLSPWARVVDADGGPDGRQLLHPQPRRRSARRVRARRRNAPYVIGCLWTAMAPPPLPSPLPQIRAIRTLTGNQIVFTEAPPSVTIQTAPTPPVAMPAPPAPTGPYQTIAMNPAGVQVATPTMVSILVGTTSVVDHAAAVNVQVGSAHARHHVRRDRDARADDLPRRRRQGDDHGIHRAPSTEAREPMPPAARVTRSDDHPGFVAGPGMPTVLIGGLPAAVGRRPAHVPDAAAAGPHPAAPFPKGSVTVLIGGRPALRMGDVRLRRADRLPAPPPC